MLSQSVLGNFIQSVHIYSTLDKSTSTLKSRGPGLNGMYPNSYEQISQSTPSDDS